MKSAEMRAGRILILVTNLTFGGAETQAVRLGLDFKRRGYDVRMVSMTLPDQWVGELEAGGIQVESLRMKAGMPDLRAIFRLRGIIRRFRPDVVHCHMFHANLLGRITRLVCPMPSLICTVHNLKETSERGGGTGWKEFLYRITDRLASRTTIICKAAFERYVEVGAVPRDRLQVIPNGIDTDVFRPVAEVREKARRALGLADDEFAWFAVGRLVKQKDYPNLFRAVAQLPDSKFVVLIAGGGALEGELRGICHSLGIDQRVRFLGAREDIRDLYNAADAYVMSSEFEGFSVALLEASAMELPIVATDAGGNREIVVDGRSGYIVPTQNPAALSQRMLDVMSASASDLRRMGQEGRTFCSANFRSDVVANQWLAVYEESLKAANHPASSKLAWPQSE